MAVGINRQAVLDELGNPVPQNTGVSGYGMPGGVQAPPLAPSAPPVPPPAAPAQGMAAYTQRTNASTDPVQKAREMADAAAFDTAQAAPAAAPAGGNFNMRGYDAGKLADLGHTSEKYQIGRIQKKYDPRLGVSPEMLAELNALGIADFSGGGDKLTVNNTKNDPRFGTGGTADVVYGLKGNNEQTAWQPWFMDDGGGAAGSAGTGGLSPQSPQQGGNVGLQMAQSNLSGLLQGDPYSALQQALGRTQQPNLQALIAQLGGQ